MTVLVLLVGLLWVWVVAIVRVRACAGAPKTLSSDCAGQCASYELCLPYASPATCMFNGTSTDVQMSALSKCVQDKSSNGRCAYECMAPNAQRNASYDVLHITIPFGNREVDEIAELRALAPENQTLWIPKQRIDAVGQLVLPSTVTTVIVTGGINSPVYVEIGLGVNLHFLTGYLRPNKQITSVVMENIDMGAVYNSLPSKLPTTIEEITLFNCRIDAYPLDIARLPTLKILSLGFNQLTSVPEEAGNDRITKLELGLNKIESFDAYFPNLRSLDLTQNLLGELPPKLFLHSKLQTLRMALNRMMMLPNITLSQYDFLEGIATLDLGYIQVDELPCSHDERKVLHTVNGDIEVCIVADPTPPAASAVTTPAAIPSSSAIAHNASHEASSNTSTQTSLMLSILLSVVSVAVAIMLLVGFWLFRRRKSHSKSASTSDHAIAVFQDIAFWQDEDLLRHRVPIEDIQDVRIIGSGGFGVVWLAKYRHHQYVASKRLVGDQVTRAQVQAFLNEIKLVATLDHPHIVALVGVAWTMESDLQALFEYMDQGDLRSYLDAPDTPRHWTLAKVQLALQVAEALVYVHSFYPPLVHRDLKSRNVLLASNDPLQGDAIAGDGECSTNGTINLSNLIAKLSDFGISRFQSDQGTMTTGAGTGKWLAPEVIAGRKDYDQTSDVFAFGVVLSELDTHAVPYDDVRTDDNHHLADVAIMQRVATGELLPTFLSSCPATMLNLARQCLAFEPRDRPTAVEVAYALRKIVESVISDATQ